MLICKSFSFECCLALRSSNRPFSTVIFSTFHDSMLWLTVQFLNGLLVQILLFLKDGQLVVHRSLEILRSCIELQYGLFKEGVYHFVSNSNLYSPFSEESVLLQPAILFQLPFDSRQEMRKRKLPNPKIVRY